VHTNRKAAKIIEQIQKQHSTAQKEKDGRKQWKEIHTTVSVVGTNFESTTSTLRLFTLFVDMEQISGDLPNQTLVGGIILESIRSALREHTVLLELFQSSLEFLSSLFMLFLLEFGLSFGQRLRSTTCTDKVDGRIAISQS
jgi:hypothetical protein